MHEMRVLPCPLEVPPTRARRLGGAEEKNAGGGRTIGVWTRLFRGGGGAPLHTCFGGDAPSAAVAASLSREGAVNADRSPRPSLLHPLHWQGQPRLPGAPDPFRAPSTMYHSSAPLLPPPSPYLYFPCVRLHCTMPCYGTPRVCVLECPPLGRPCQKLLFGGLVRQRRQARPTCRRAAIATANGDHAHLTLTRRRKAKGWVDLSCCCSWGWICCAVFLQEHARWAAVERVLKRGPPRDMEAMQENKGGEQLNDGVVVGIVLGIVAFFVIVVLVARHFINVQTAKAWNLPLSGGRASFWEACQKVRLPRSQLYSWHDCPRHLRWSCPCRFRSPFHEGPSLPVCLALGRGGRCGGRGFEASYLSLEVHTMPKCRDAVG